MEIDDDEIKTSSRTVQRFDLDVKTLFLFATILVGLAINWATLSAKSDDTNRRVTLLEQQLVPRIEHDLRDKALTERLSRIESIVVDIQQRVVRK